MSEIPVAYDAFVLQDGTNKAFRSYAFGQEGHAYLIGIPERPLPEELCAGLTTVTDILILEPNREIIICNN